MLVLLSFLLLPYQGYNAPDGKKWMGLADHICRNELKYSAKVSKFVQKTVDLTIQLEKVLCQQEANFKVRIVKWLRTADEKW